jgi:hypothetical protein
MATKQHNATSLSQVSSREPAPTGVQQPQQQLQQPTAINGVGMSVPGMENNWAQAYSAAMYSQQQQQQLQKGGNVTTPAGLAPPHHFLNNPHLAASLNNPAFAAQLLMATGALSPQANGLSPDMVTAAGMMMGAASPLYPQQNPSSASRKTSTKITPSGSSANLQQGAQIKTAQQQQLHLRAANNTTTTTNINNNFTKDRKRLNSNATTTTATITATAYQPLSSSPAAATINMNNNKTNTNNNATAAAINIKTESAADDRELKRQRRKQSNRESARRSRLRKQAETEELGNILERYATENMKLRSAVERLASEREIRLENERVLAKCIEDSGIKVPDLKQVENPFVVSSLEAFAANNNDGVLTRSDTTTNSGGEGTNNSTDG